MEFINRNNYEEILILYIDRELSATEKAMADLFLNNNSDIQQEFKKLLALKLPTENICFADKSTLLKSEKAINLNNYEENFLLYVDEELSQTEKQNIERFVLQNPSLQPAFTNINNTKLEAELIKHPNKSELYKKERKPILFLLQRVAVAAAVFGFLFFTWNIISNQSNANKNSVKSEQKTNFNSTFHKQKKAEISANKFTIKLVFTRNKTTLNHTSKSLNELNKIHPKQDNLIEIVATNKNQLQKNQTEIHEIISDSKSSVYTNQNPETTVNSNSQVSNNTSEFENITATTVNFSPLSYQSVSLSNNIVYKKLELEDESEKSVLIGNSEFNKTKVDGLLKKITSLFSRKKIILPETEKATLTTL